MGLSTQYETVLTCDVCGEMYVEALTQSATLKLARSQGWHFSNHINRKMTRCPKCKPDYHWSHKGRPRLTVHKPRVTTMQMICPICKKERVIYKSQYYSSKKLNPPELVGVCNLCYMRVVRPAKKRTAR